MLLLWSGTRISKTNFSVFRDLWGINRLFCQLWKRNRNRRVSAIMQERLRTNVCAVLCYGLSMHCWTPWLSGSVGFRLAQGEQPVEQDTMSHHNGKQACLADTRSSAYLLWSVTHHQLRRFGYVLLSQFNDSWLLLSPVWAEQDSSDAAVPLISCSGRWWGRWDEAEWL